MRAKKEKITFTQVEKDVSEVHRIHINRIHLLCVCIILAERDKGNFNTNSMQMTS